MIKNYSLFLAVLCALTILPGGAKSQIITSVVGNFNSDGYGPTSIGLNPVGEVLDAAGNMYIAVPDRHIVLKLSAAGTFSTLAGTGISGYSGDNGLAKSAQLRNPWKVAVDAAGNVLIADNIDNRIRKVTPAGIITTIAGNGRGGWSGDGGLATSACLQGPVAVALDASGNMFIADYANRRVRKVTTAGIISTVAGNGVSGIGGDNGPGTSAQLGFVSAITFNNSGELLIADNPNGKVRKLNKSGIITTAAGIGGLGFSGDGGLATLAKFNAINGLAVDKSGNLFICDTYNSRIRKVNTSGIVTTVAGTGANGFGGDGGLATAAQMYRPRNVAVDLSGNLLISGSFKIRKVTVSTGIITTMVGNGSGGYCGDNGSVTKAQIYHPVGVAADGAGNVFVVDRENHRIRKISSTGIMTTLAGTGKPGFSGDGGPASAASINLPTSVAVDKAGNVFFSDYTNNRIRKVSTSGIITTIAGISGPGGFSGDGVAITAKLFGPDGVSCDASGNVYFADQFNNRIRKITTTGTIVTVAGSGGQGFSGDGGSALQATFFWPNNVKVDKAGNIIINDRRNYRVRKVSTTGIITTIAGKGSQGFSGDGGLATLAGVDPMGIAVDTSGNIFISDNTNERIRRVNKSGIISTVAGKGPQYGDGGLALSGQILTPNGISTDPAGNLFVTDYDNHRIRKIALAGVKLSRSTSPVSISDVTTANKFSIYPNPVQHTLNIQSERAGAITMIEVLDATGKIVLSKKISTVQSRVSVPLTGLVPGSYFIRTTGDDKSIQVSEFIKN